jgi:hypothetical protein
MKVTKQEILEAIAENNIKFFEYADDNYDDVDKIYSYSFGDGNETGKTYHFKDFDIYVNIEGVYSSWEGTAWQECYISEPFIFTETQYRRKNES